MRMSRPPACHWGMRVPGRSRRWPFPLAMLLAAVLTAGYAGGLTGRASPASAAVLTSPIWTASKTTVGATSVSYTYTFTTATTSVLNSVTMTVPPGTTGTPVVGTVTPVTITIGSSVSLSGTTLTYSFTAAAVIAATAVSIHVTGLTNTATAGKYTSEIVTNGLTGPVGP